MIDINEHGNRPWKDDEQRNPFPPVRYTGNGVSLTYKLPEPMTFDGVLQELVRLNLHTHNRIKSVTFELAEW